MTTLTAGLTAAVTIAFLSLLAGYGIGRAGRAKAVAALRRAASTPQPNPEPIPAGVRRPPRPAEWPPYKPLLPPPPVTGRHHRPEPSVERTHAMPHYKPRTPAKEVS